jgi:hypothetical protein
MKELKGNAYIYNNRCFSCNVVIVREAEKLQRFGKDNILLTLDRYYLSEGVWKKVDSIKEWRFTDAEDCLADKIPEELWKDVLVD